MAVRVVLHVDLDSFYSQVEERRLGLIDHDNPLAVLQWDALIAVNYSARSRGVKRGDSASVAREKCPDIQIVHVATYAPGDSTARYHTAVGPDHKVSLDLYRQASLQIMNIMQRFSNIFERGGLDEAFLDVSQQCLSRARVARRSELDWSDLGCIISPFGIDGKQALWEREVGNGLDLCLSVEQLQDDEEDEHAELMDKCLYEGALIAKELRDAVFAELGYRCSAGVAHNKVLAKIGSAMNKPNQQTVIRQCAVLSVMRELPLRKIKNLGGKTGRAVAEELNITTAGELWAFSLEDLEARFGKSVGHWIFRVCRGNEDSAVVPRDKTKSIMATKTFGATSSMDIVRGWLEVFAAEVITRIKIDADLHHRLPRTLQVTYRQIQSGRSQLHSRSCPLTPQMRTNESVMVNAAVALLEAASIFPCSNIGLSATNFTDAPKSGRAAITTFFHKASDTAEKQQPTTNAELTEESLQRTLFVRCDDCDCSIDIYEMDEHRDRHVALRLQSEWNAEERAHGDGSARKAKRPKTLKDFWST